MRRRISSAVAVLFLAATAPIAPAQQQPATPTEPPTPHHVVCAKTFQQADANKDGVITMADLQPAEQQDDFIAKADTNNDGLVTIPEFNAGCSKNLFHKAGK